MSAQLHGISDRVKTKLMLSLLFNYFGTFSLWFLIVIAQSEKACSQLNAEFMDRVCSASDSFGLNSPHEETCLLICSRRGDEYCITQLLDNRVDIDTRDDSEEAGFPLIVATKGNHYNSVALLVSRGANVNLQTFSGTTALLLAAQEGNEAIVTLLLDNGADTNLRSTNGAFPLFSAALYCHPGCVALLLKRVQTLVYKPIRGIPPCRQPQGMAVILASTYY